MVSRPLLRTMRLSPSASELLHTPAERSRLVTKPYMKLSGLLGSKPLAKVTKRSPLLLVSVDMTAPAKVAAASAATSAASTVARFRPGMSMVAIAGQPAAFSTLVTL